LRFQSFYDKGFLLDNRLIISLLAILLIIIFVDTSLIKLQNVTSINNNSDSILFAFSIMIIATIVIQFYFILYANLVNSRLKSKQGPRIAIALWIAQVFLSLIMLYVLLTIFISDSYSLSALFVLFVVSYGLSSAMFIIFSTKLFSWYSSSRSFIIILYAVSSSILVINIISALFFVAPAILNLPTEINSKVFASGGLYIKTNSLYDLVYRIYFTSALLSFVSIWIATAIIMYHHTSKIGRTKYWILLSLPLAYFLSQFLAFQFHLLDPLVRSDPRFYSVFLPVFFTVSSAIGGIMFGLSFWFAARGLSDKRSILKLSLTLSAIGLMVFFLSNQATILLRPYYPAFGLLTISCVGLSSYLVFVGIYSSAIAIAQNSELRREIMRLANHQAKMFGGIGGAEVQRQIETNVLETIKRSSHLIENFKQSTEGDNIMEYVHEVIEELHNSSNSKENT
jgi:hypothetical protein